MWIWESYIIIVDLEKTEKYLKCFCFTIVLCMFFIGACSMAPRYTRSSSQNKPSHPVYSGKQKSATVPPSDGRRYAEIGYASYYANNLNGKKTASGEPYYKDVYTAAHRTLPFNTLIKVTNLSNNKSVIVRINDRGPFSRKRILDISRCAAEDLGMIRSGIGKVKLEVID